MLSIDKRVLLATLVLILIAIWFCNMNFAAYSTKEILEECLIIQTRYNELRGRNATESEWQEFERTSQETLAPIVADLEKMCRTSSERYSLHQLTKYDIPRAIQSRGRGKEADKDFVVLNKNGKSTLSALLQKQKPKMKPKKITSNESTDPVVVYMLVFDGLLAVGVIYLLWPKRKGEITQLSAEDDPLLRRLELLDKKIEKKPKAAAYRGTRARLRAEMGLREEAIEDIDWLMERKPHGVDLLALYELRESLVEEIDAEDENVDEKQ